MGSGNGDTVELIIATRNPGKVEEISRLFADLSVRISSLLEHPDIPDVVEDGKTFEENAHKKAAAIAGSLGMPALADDSGLLVDYLDGAPGVRSSRYFGPGLTDQEKVSKLLELLAGVPRSERTARFHCAAVLVIPGGDWWVTEGSCEGVIALQPSGTNGFGYDPVFFVPALGKTFAELRTVEKETISHRGRAMRLMKDILAGLLP
ncbi:XTP/dITP diphosphatase [bacterium]|nr:XTP/dITP diphosphatase [candidate division CSSED10-310 bacterium]